MWISFKVRLLTWQSVVKSWSVCIPGGQEPGSVPRVACWCPGVLVCPQRNSALNKSNLCITHSSKPGTSQPLFKNGRVLWWWLLLNERQVWGTCVDSNYMKFLTSCMWAVGCCLVVQIWEHFLKESMWPMLALQPVCTTQHLCLMCNFMLQYSFTLLKEFVLDRNFHYVAPDILFFQTEYNKYLPFSLP